MPENNKKFAVIISNQSANNEKDGFLITTSETTDLSNLMQEYPHKMFNKYYFTEDTKDIPQDKSESKSVGNKIIKPNDLLLIDLNPENKRENGKNHIQKALECNEIEKKMFEKYNDSFRNLPRGTVIFYESKKNELVKEAAYQLGRSLSDYQVAVAQSPRVVGLIALSFNDEKLQKMCEENLLKTKISEIRDVKSLKKSTTLK